MTKATLKEMYAKFNNEVSTAHYNDTTLEQLQDLCEEFGDGNRWCSWERCLEEVIKAGKSKGAITRAFMLYNEKIENEAEFRVLLRIATATNNFNI